MERRGEKKSGVERGEKVRAEERRREESRREERIEQLYYYRVKVNIERVYWIAQN